MVFFSHFHFNGTWKNDTFNIFNAIQLVEMNTLIESVLLDGIPKHCLLPESNEIRDLWLMAFRISSLDRGRDLKII